MAIASVHKLVDSNQSSHLSVPVLGNAILPAAMPLSTSQAFVDCVIDFGSGEASLQVQSNALHFKAMTVTAPAMNALSNRRGKHADNQCC